MHSVNNTSALSSDERIERAMYGQGKKNKKPKTWLNLSIKELKIYIITLSLYNMTSRHEKAKN